MSDKMAIALFSGTADKLQAAATMASGAAAMGVEVHVFLTLWGANAFRKEMVGRELPWSADYGQEGENMAKLMAEKGAHGWYEVFGMAKDVGDVHFHACSHTMDLMDLSLEDMDPMVEDIIGVATFIRMTEDAQVLFI
jgi:peroxiredoxin family protein